MKRLLALLIPIALLLASCAAAENAALSPTTGLPSDRPYRPVLVQVDNDESARPIHGLSQADIVYESVYWGPGYTRYLALFNDAHPEVVGSVRSARLFWSELRQMWDCPYVFWGAQGRRDDGSNSGDFFKAYNVPASMLIDGTRPSPEGVLYRSLDNVKPPHNAMVHLDRLVEEHWPEAEDGTPYAPKLPNMKFDDIPSAGAQAAHAIDIVYPQEHFAARYVYDAETRMYDRWYDGKPQTDDAKTPIRVSNVIVQYMWLSYYDNKFSLPVLRTTGSGPIDVFIDGTHIRGTWVRDDMNAWVRYLDQDGNELTFLPGKTYIQMVPMEMSISYEDEQGAQHRLGAEVRTLSPQTSDK